MAETVVALALETLRDLIVEEAKFLSRVSSHFDEVRSELEILRSYLKDADERQHRQGNEVIRTWVQEARNLAYRAEDVFEEYAIKIASKRGKGTKKVLKRVAGLVSEGLHLHQLGKEILNIKTGITNLTKNLHDYGILQSIREVNNVEDDRQKWIRRTHAHQVEEHFVGMEDDLQRLISFITDASKDNQVISIWGMGGLGKTTLARKIYQHENVQKHFTCFAWASISQQCQIRTVVESILKQLLGDHKREAVMSMGDSELVEELYTVQREKKCLIVLDDIWKEEDWESLAPAFPIRNGRSKVLLTTRIEELAKASGCPNKLECLNDEEAVELLLKKALANRDSKDFKIEEDFQNLARAIAGKCHGLPLAISSIGGILRNRNSLREWEKVNEDVGLYLRKGEGKQGAYGSVLQILAMSYNDLPFYLKPCFLYMGFLLEDEEIDVSRLYELWIGEGLVLSKHREENQSMTDVAEQYLSELASRSMVEVEVGEDPTVQLYKFCYLHDLMRELCLVKGKDEEFIKLVDHRHEKQVWDPNPSFSAGDTFRLAIHLAPSTGCNPPYELTIKRHTRSLMFFCDTSAAAASIPYRCLRYKHYDFCRSLRTLTFHNLNLRELELLDEIGKLILLRYLSFYKCYFGRPLPKSIGNLTCLQSLNIEDCEALLPFPNIFWKLKQLRHLCLDQYVDSKSGTLQFHGLHKLESIHGLDSGRDDLTFLCELKNLQSLSVDVSDNSSLSTILAQISGLNNLKELSLDLGETCDLISEEGQILLWEALQCQQLRTLWLVTPVRMSAKSGVGNLVTLKLSETHLEQEAIEVLQEFPNLGKLSFYEGSFNGKEMSIDLLGFPALKSLFFDGLSNFENLKISEGALPKLRILIISFCEKLEMIPQGLRHITTLKVLLIKEMPESFKRRIQVVNGEEGVDYEEIRHVSRVEIDS